MNTRLTELSLKEEKLLQTIDSTRGSIEEKLERLFEMDINDQYISVHDEYAKICNGNIEALKRGLFLIWHSRLEPEFISGIRQLNSISEDKIMSVIIRRMKAGILDYELDWMISYYSEWLNIFNAYPKFIDLAGRKVQTNVPSKIDLQEMSNRGTMGKYWYSLNKR